MKGFMSAINQKTYQVREKLGNSKNSTQNVDFLNLKTRTEQSHKKLVLVHQHIQKTVDNYKAIQVIQSELHTDFVTLYGSGPISGAIASYENVINDVGEKQTDFAERIKADVLDPLTLYLDVFKDVKKRIEELNHRRIDMDRYNEKRLKLAEKQTGSKEKLPEIDAKYRVAREGYETLLAELMTDLKALDEDVCTFVSPIFAAFVRLQSEFLGKMNGSFAGLPPQVSQVNTAAVHSHQAVITPLEFSAMTRTTQPGPASGGSGSGSTTPTPNESAGSKPLPKPPRPLPSASAQAKGVYDFTASEPTELSFRQGDVLTIRAQNGDWWDAELNGRTGQIPANYVKLL